VATLDERQRIEALIAELEAQKLVFVDPIEGCEDLLRLNITPESQHAVTTLLNDFKRRVQRIDETISALNRLLDDGYPAIPEPTFSHAVAEDIAAQDRTVSAAAGFFPVAPQATTINVSTSSPVPK
jgi:hypothetical protein